MTNILVLGSCRLNFNLNKYNLLRADNIQLTHNHNEILSIIIFLTNNNNDNNILTDYSKIKKSVPENSENNLFKLIEKNNIVLLEICTIRSYFEYISNDLYISSNVGEYIGKYNDNLSDCNYIKIGNSSQKRDDKIETIFFRKDNIILLNKNLYCLLKVGNYVKNKEFLEINYNKEQQETIIKIENMPNNYFQTFSIGFDYDYMVDLSYNVKICINCNSNKDIFIKYYNGTEYIYTNQKVNNNILIENLKIKIFIGFYKKNATGEIMTSNLLKETNEFLWNINFNIKSYEIIINNLKEIDNTLPKIAFTQNESFKSFINNFYYFLEYFKNKKIVVVPHLTIKDNDEEIIPEYVNNSRMKFVNLLKETIPKIPNCYFFENNVYNDLLDDQNHYNEDGYKTVGKCLEKFLNDKVNKN